MQRGGCSTCSAPNVAAARFCVNCGAPLDQACPSCGARAQASARFCIQCGATLGGAEAAKTDSRTPGEERRTVTVLFADIVGYTSLAEQLDHESVKALTDRCLTRFASEVERFGGHIDQYIGDNVMAVFGAPVAHEDDGERAVRAAWAMQTAMAELNRGIGPEFGFELALRVGANTGEVLAGRIGDEYTVVGDAVNVAARLQGAARIGGVLVGERTKRCTAGAVKYRKVGPLMLKGKAEAVNAWEVVALREPRRTSKAIGSSAPLVGRRGELSQLHALFERVTRDRSPQLVTILGEAGVGKTRLMREFERRLKRRGAAFHIRRGHCPGFGAGVIYWPLLEMLRAECGILPADTGAQVRSKLADRLGPPLAARESWEGVERRLAPLARLLGVGPAEPTAAPTERDQRSARESFFGAVRAVVEALANEQTLVLVWEDIHWADEGTLDLVEYLAQWLRAPVLQVCLAREELLERRPSWGKLRRATASVLLEPLTEREARELIDALASRTGAPIETPDRLAERSGGNPLFAEALVDRVAEQGGTAPAELPDTVQGLLAARLDSLGPLERRLLGHAAVIGRSFPQSSLAPIAGAGGSDLGASLLALREKNLIVLADTRDRAGESEFAFKHLLIRDVAYEMLPKAVRARKHAEVGTFVERRAGERGEAVAALLAEHFTRAATLAAEAHLSASEIFPLRRRALECCEAAGDAAAELFSNQEALDHYRAAGAFAEPGEAIGVRIADKSGDVELRLGRTETAIDVWQKCLTHYSECEDLQHAAQMHRKIAAAFTQKGERDSAIEQLQHGIELIGHGPPSLELVRLFEQAALLCVIGGDNIWAVYAAERALRFAKGLGEPRAASRAHGVYGRVFGRIGDAEKARENLEQAVQLARGFDDSDAILALLAMGRNLEDCEGDYRGAHRRYEEALGLAERIGDVPAQIELRAALAQLAFYRCDWEEVSRASHMSATLAEREGLVGKLCLPNKLNGQLRWREGEWDASERLFGHAHEVARHGGWFEVSISALSGLAATLRDRGDLDSAESALGQALAICERSGFVPQALQVNAALALTRTLAGRTESAREAAAQAIRLGRRVHDPVDGAAAMEARGIVAELPEGLRALHQAGLGWERLGRRLDAARCVMLFGRRLREQRPEAADRVLSRAARTFDELGVPHLAERSRELLPA
jgi:class 3 adenylate cyclase/tetratricopeptide (TPR) repeat protein